MDDFNFYNSENDGYRGGFGDSSRDRPPIKRAAAASASPL